MSKIKSNSDNFSKILRTEINRLENDFKIDKSKIVKKGIELLNRR